MGERKWHSDSDDTYHQVPADLGEDHDLGGTCWCRPIFYTDFTHHRSHRQTIDYLEGRLDKVKQQRTDARAEVKELKGERDDLLDRLEAAEEEITLLERQRDGVVEMKR